MTPPRGPWLRSLLREPLLHFLVIGALIAGGHRWYLAHTRPELRITREWLESLARDYELRAGHQPDAAARAKLLDDYIEEEILFREALKTGHEEDPRVRHLLALTMREALEPVVPDPSDAQLEELRLKDPASFRFPAGVSFEHASFPSMSEVPAGFLEKLQAGEPPHSAPGIRLPSPVPETWLPQIERMFGPDFAREIERCKRGEWTGPVTSLRGAHFVKLLKYTPARDMPMAEVRPALATKWITDQQKRAVSEKVAGLKRGYRIVLPQESPAGK